MYGRDLLCDITTVRNIGKRSMFQKVWLSEMVSPRPLNQVDSEMTPQSVKGLLGFLETGKVLGISLFNSCTLTGAPCRSTEETTEQGKGLS